MDQSTTPQSLLAEAVAHRRPSASFGGRYCRLTLAFVIGLYLPWAMDAPDLWRHFGEALHSWTIVFFAPIAAWRLLSDALGDS